MNVPSIPTKNQPGRSRFIPELHLDREFVRSFRWFLFGENHRPAAEPVSFTLEKNSPSSLTPLSTPFTGGPLLGVETGHRHPPVHRNRIRFFQEGFDGIDGRGESEVG